jgi:hypothetical protein
MNRTSKDSLVSGGGGNLEIRIRGQLSDFLLAAFEGLSATVEPVQTVVHGPVRDQSEPDYTAPG